MVHEQRLSSVLSEFARTLATDFPIQSILDHLVERIVDVLPITGAGVTLIEEGEKPHYVAASDPAALRYEQLQTELVNGPCVAAFESGEPVLVPDLRNDERFSAFAERASREGLLAVFTFPLRDADGQLGALDLYRHTAGDLSPSDLTAAQTLADVAAAYLINARSRERESRRTERYRQSSLRDPLTGLPNRALLEQQVDRAAVRAEKSGRIVAVLYVDLDQFKRINDTYGHQTGDELLVAVAHRLSALIRPTDTLARMSGDEFVILCEDLRCAGDAEGLARRVGEALVEPFQLSAMRLTVTASVGIAYAGRGQDVAQRLLHNADTAMYQAKRGGGARHQMFDFRQAHLAAERLMFERDLRVAMAAGDLDLWYQPIVRLCDGLVTGVEALLRWTHLNRGAVPPPAAIAAAERSGMIDDLGAWVLEEACVQQRLWQPHLALDMAVNVSPSQLVSRGFAESVRSVLERTGVDPTALVLEVTEDVLIEDSDRAMRVLADLKALGVRLALDDFGTGYSSLNYLRNFPVDIVKIDQVFVADLGRDAADTAIVGAVAGLARVLDLHVIAEGVETHEQRSLLTDMGCESSQGYFFAKPMPGSALTRELELAGSAMHLPVG